MNRYVSPSPVGRNPLQSSMVRPTHPINRETFVRERRSSYPGLTRVRCFRCGELGHVARFCTQGERQPGEMVLGIVNSPHTGSVEFLSPIVSLGGMELRARIDTGADKSLLSRIFASSLLEQGGVNFSNQQVHLCGVSGKRVQAFGKVTGSFEWKGIAREPEFVVVEGLPVPMLIGVDLLQASEAVIDFGKYETLTGTPLRQGEIDWVKMEELAQRSGAVKTRLLGIFQHLPELFCTRPGMVAAVQHRIETGDAAPIYSHPYSLPKNKAKIVEIQVQEMLDAGIIEQSDSSWAAPVVLVPKKDGSTRFCVDYRLLNNVTREDRYPLPLIPVVLRNIGNACIWSTLDLQSGYYTPEEHYQDVEKVLTLLHKAGLTLKPEK
ncbi:Transposon Ty3-I Gag-Pol polyprotein [Araneus ventricosus]|uniref:Transposon Ty3-I Gag-Pol polyprotein n=1 Tax=Araneus ventricosus TaxID=182803 RepID=A0A4Y2H860_ARAVE|nr:Transposon Ty3-I Gag-Pol polyprotein [Araneus ventricosus]